MLKPSPLRRSPLRRSILGSAFVGVAAEPFTGGVGRAAPADLQKEGKVYPVIEYHNSNCPTCLSYGVDFGINNSDLFSPSRHISELNPATPNP